MKFVFFLMILVNWVGNLKGNLLWGYEFVYRIEVYLLNFFLILLVILLLLVFVMVLSLLFLCFDVLLFGFFFLIYWGSM